MKSKVQKFGFLCTGCLFLGIAAQSLCAQSQIAVKGELPSNFGRSFSKASGSSVRLLPISFASKSTSTGLAKQEALPPVASHGQGNQDGRLPNPRIGNAGSGNSQDLSSPLSPKTAIPRGLQGGLGTQQEGVVKLLKPLSKIETEQREVITRRYPTGETQLIREVVLDNNGNYVSEGRWRLYGKDKQLIGKGQFQNGLMFGSWKRLHLDRNHPWLRTEDFQGFQFPLISSADFEAGELEGLWSIADKDQKKIVDFFFAKGKRQGTWVWYFPDGKKRREIQFEKGLIHGRWMEWDQQGKETKKDWYQEGHRVYIVTSYFEQQKPETQSTFMAGKLELSESDDWWNARLAAYNQMGPDVQHGPVQSWYDNGQSHMKGYYKKGQRDGVFAWWHSNGSRKAFGSFTDGKQVGKWRWWFDNGIKESEGGFIEGLADGQWIKWDRSGNPVANEMLEPSKDKTKVARPAFENQGTSAAPLGPLLEMTPPGKSEADQTIQDLPKPKGLRDDDPIPQNKQKESPDPTKSGVSAEPTASVPKGSPNQNLKLHPPVGSGLKNGIQLSPAGDGRVTT